MLQAPLYSCSCSFVVVVGVDGMGGRGDEVSSSLHIGPSLHPSNIPVCSSHPLPHQHAAFAQYPSPRLPSPGPSSPRRSPHQGWAHRHRWPVPQQSPVAHTRRRWRGSSRPAERRGCCSAHPQQSARGGQGGEATRLGRLKEAAAGCCACCQQALLAAAASPLAPP